MNVRKTLERSTNLLPGENPRTTEGILEYYLLESELCSEDAELRGKTIYGIEILKKTHASDEVFSADISTCFDFSSNKETVRALIQKLADNTVTPITLRYILDDLLGVE